MDESDFRTPASGPRGSFGEDGGGPGDAGLASSEISGEQSWRNLLKLDTELYLSRKIRILTPEARVLIHLKLNGSMTVTEAMQLAGVSYRGFYAVLERLRQAGLVGQVKDKEDQRVRNLSLDPSNPIPSARL